jgi:membrane protease YdiL (CAAX protease family)
MNDAPIYAVNLTMGIAFLVSLATLFRLFQRHIDGRPLLEYEPRRPVPWNLLAPLVMLAPLILALSHVGSREAEPDVRTTVTAAAETAAFSAAGAPAPAASSAAQLSAAGAELVERLANAETLAWRLLLQSLITVAMAIVAYLLLAVVFGATVHDLGLPTNMRQLVQDVKIGATACVASIAPIYLLMLALTTLLEPKSGHPLIEELIIDHSLSMMAAAALAAVVAAPLYEETAFRLIFQGWLERREMLSQPVIMRTAPAMNTPASGEPPIVEGFEEPQPATEVTYSYAPPGWTPILISGILFGLAHYGHGVSPVPLILLGFIMGYIYQRTHRVTPSIVCHLLFNAFTFLILTLQFAGPVERNDIEPKEADLKANQPFQIRENLPHPRSSASYFRIDAGRQISRLDPIAVKS